MITELPVEQMAFLSLGIPTDDETAEIIRTLLSGGKVGMLIDGIEYKRYKKTAALGIYQKFMGMERELREMGICVIRSGH